MPAIPLINNLALIHDGQNVNLIRFAGALQYLVGFAHFKVYVIYVLHGQYFLAPFTANLVNLYAGLPHLHVIAFLLNDLPRLMKFKYCPAVRPAGQSVLLQNIFDLDFI